MHEATLTIDYVNQPDKNPDFGSIKAGGVYYGVPKDMLSKFQKGATITVGYTSTERGGRTYHNIKEVRAKPATTNGHASPNGNGKDPDYDLKVGAQAKFNVIAPSIVDYVLAKGGTINEAWIADLYTKCLAGHALGWKRYQQITERRGAAPYDDRVDDIGDTLDH